MATHSTLHRKDNIFTEENISKNAFKLLMLSCMAYILMTNNLTLGLGDSARSDEIAKGKEIAEKKPQKIKTAKASLMSFHKEEKRKMSHAEIKNLANQFHNIAFVLDPNLASYKDIPQEVVHEKMKICADYVKKYAPIAKLEEQKMGIPASITLAQGLLESDAGGSRLTRSAANHFGIKCFSHHCKKGHCKNFTDDTHKDFFVVYQSAWQSFRAHSAFLKNGSRYNALFRLRKNDYKSWANGLKSAGYATDKKYNEKLIRIIETLRLNNL